MNLNNFQLLKEDNDSYQVGHPNGKAIVVSKSGLSEKAHGMIKKLRSPKFDDGGMTGVDLSGLKDFQKEEQAESAPVAAPSSFASQMDSQKLASNSPVSDLVVPSDSEPPPSQTISPQANGLEQQISAIKNQGYLANEESKAQTKEFDEAEAKRNALPTQQDITERNRAKSDELEKKFGDQEIDPDRYWHDKSTGSKVLAGIGMLFSGIGSAMSGQPNYAMDTINSAINRDIDAQKNDQSRTMNLWKMNREALGSDLAANLATQNQYDSILKYKLMKIGSQYGGPLAQQKAMQEAGALQTKMDERNALLGLHSTLTGHAQPGTEQEFNQNLTAASALDKDLYKDAQSRYLPGVGIASKPITKEDGDALTEYAGMEELVNKAKNFTNVVGRTYPLTQANKMAGDLADQMRLQVNKLFKLNRINEYEAKKFDSMISNPGGWNTPVVQQSFTDLGNLIKTQRNAEMNKLGVHPFKGSANQNVSQQQYNPGSVLDIKGQRFVVNPDGKTARPLQ